MNSIIATIDLGSIYIKDDIFDSEEEKELYLTSSYEQKLEFIRDHYYSRNYLDDFDLIIDLHE